jgi:predicted transcriptional regulator
MDMNNYDEVVESKFHNQKIRISCIVTGKSLTPYHIPKVINVKCFDKECVACEYQTEVELTMMAVDQNILRFIDITTAKMPIVLKQVLNIKCKNFNYDVVEMQLVERIYVARPTGKERTRKGGGSRPAYLIGISVESNNIYHLEGYTTVDPVTQSVTHVFTEAKKKANDVESFSITTDKHNALNEFCINTKDPNVMFDRLEVLYTNYAHNITKIYERFDLHMCVDLLFRSVISFRFDNEYVHKGWMEAMVVGDPRCGKGYVAEKLLGYFGLGEVVSGENTSFSGLVGGLQQLNKHWVITWGKIPMNDCGLLVVDESGGMEENMWGKMSRIRSEGVAEITKIQTEVANARTRLLFLCNPPNKMISNYSYGIQSLHELVKAPEDIARFDYVLVVAHNEVKGEVINQRREPLPKIYEAQLEQDLILWCWSRKPNDVRFSKEAIKLVYGFSMKLEGLYDFSIPLIQVENVRFKLAKIAIAFAARFYSNVEDGKVLLVKTVHVECAYIFFDLIYGKNQSGYKAYSTMKKSVQEVVTPEKLHSIEVYFDSWKLQKKELMRFLLINNSIDNDSLMTHLGCEKITANECMSKLLKAGCITKKGQNYYKAPDFTEYLKEKMLKK